MDTTLDKLVKELENALREQYETSHSIQKSGKIITIPEHMEIPDAISALQKHVEEMEEDAQKEISITCHPDDGLNALYEAIVEQFGHLVGRSMMSFFGMIPAKEHTIVTGYNETRNVPIGKVEIPGMAGKLSMYIGYSGARDPMMGNVVLTIHYQKKYQPLVDNIEEAWKRKLAEFSIFSGKAIDSRWEFIGTKEKDTSFIVYTDDEMATLNANLFMPIRQTKALASIGESVRRTILLHGKFGTGKTLTALLAAQIAEKNGWTFINVRPGDDIVSSLNFAVRFQPCVVFFEDVDVATASERNDGLNKVLNTVDGILSKDTRVITVLTTNRLETINRAMLRPGRIDDVIELGAIDPVSVAKLVTAYAGDLLSEEPDGERLWRAALGDTDNPYVPAFIAEAVKRAKRYGLAASGDGSVRITNEDLDHALVGLQSQWDLMNSKRQEERRDTMDAALFRALEDTADVLSDNLKDSVEEVLEDRLEDCALKGCG